MQRIERSRATTGTAPASPVRGRLSTEAEADALVAWREAVRRASDAIGLIEIPSTRFVELSPSARALVGAGTESGLEVLVPSQREDAVMISTAAAAGMIDGIEARRRTWRRLDGSTVEVMVRTRAIRLRDSNFCIWVARDLASTAGAARPWSGDGADRPAGHGPAGTSFSIELDQRWRVQHVADTSERWSEVLSRGASLTAMTHPADITALVFAFAGATTQVEASARVRLHAGNEWVAADIGVGKRDDHTWYVSLSIPQSAPPAALAEAVVDERVRTLEGSLHRIAIELHGAGVMTASGPTVDVLLVPRVSRLPERQREIVVRLVRGERVGTIAAEMFLSENTIRNHLSAVFRKFGVHSQRDLLVLLRAECSSG